jgi:acyl dehydratase
MSDPDQPVSQTPALWEGALEEARRLIGVELRRHDHFWNTEANPDSVRQFSWGIGDENPLFCDPGYGAGTRWGSALAPGCFLYTIDSAVVAPKLRGIQWLYGGTSWEWYRPIHHRDRFTTQVKLIDAVEKKGGHARSFIVQTGESLFFNQNDPLVARARGSTARTPRARAEGGLKYKPREAYRYSPEELEAIDRGVRDEKLRGADPRFWEDVQDGDALDPLVKGPLNITDMICWYSGAGHTYKAHERAQRYRSRHPADSFVNPATGAKDSAARGHAEQAMAREVGMPGGYDVGPQRISWLGQLVTNWIGDDGFMRALDVKLRRPNIFGDTSWCRGRVTGKRVEDGARLVDLEIRVENQFGEVTADGRATAELPSRAAEMFPAERLHGSA